MDANAAEQWQCKSSVILVLLKEAIPSEEQLLKFHAMQQFMHWQFNSILPAGKIESYGSLASNCLLPDSDVDLCVVLDGVEGEPDKRSWRLNVLRAVGDIIWRSRRTVARNTYDLRASARIPVIVFKHDVSSIAVDINTMTSGTFKAAFVRSMLSLHPVLRPMIRLVKAWARRSGLNDPTQGGLNSYCLTLLAISHLQQLAEPLLPPVWQLFQRGSPVNSSTTPRQPASDDRPMHDGKFPSADAHAVCDRNTALWLSTNAPNPQSAPSLDVLLMSFLVRLAALLLARWTNTGDLSWRTVSTWYGVTGRCMCQKLRPGGRSAVSRDAVEGDAEWPAMLCNLLSVLAEHWPQRQSGRRQALEGAITRVEAAAKLILYDSELPEFAKFTLKLREKIAEEDGQGADAAGEHSRATGGTRKPRHGLEGIDINCMRDVVVQILVAVPYEDAPRMGNTAAASAAPSDAGDGSDSDGSEGDEGSEGGVNSEHGGGIEGGDAGATVEDVVGVDAVGQTQLNCNAEGVRRAASPTKAQIDEDMLILDIGDDEEDGMGGVALGAGLDAVPVGGEPRGAAEGQTESGPPAVDAGAQPVVVAGNGGMANGVRGSGGGVAVTAAAAAKAALAAAGLSGVRGGLGEAGAEARLAGAGSGAQDLEAADAIVARAVLQKMRTQRMQDWRYRFAVEDPFNEADNAARSLMNMDELLTEALLPVLWGEDALRPLLRRPARAAGAERDRHALMQLELSVRETAAAAALYDYPVLQRSPLSQHVSRQVAGWLKDVPAFGALQKDDALAQKLEKLYYAAGGTRDALSQAAARRQPPPQPRQQPRAHAPGPQYLQNGGRGRGGGGRGGPPAAHGHARGAAVGRGPGSPRGTISGAAGRGPPSAAARVHKALAADLLNAHLQQPHPDANKVHGGMGQRYSDTRGVQSRVGDQRHGRGVQGTGQMLPIAQKGGSPRFMDPPSHYHQMGPQQPLPAQHVPRPGAGPPGPPPGAQSSGRQQGQRAEAVPHVRKISPEELFDSAQVGQPLQRPESGACMEEGSSLPGTADHVAPAADLAALDAHRAADSVENRGRGAAEAGDGRGAAHGGPGRGRARGGRATRAGASHGGVAGPDDGGLRVNGDVAAVTADGGGGRGPREKGRKAKSTAARQHGVERGGGELGALSCGVEPHSKRGVEKHTGECGEGAKAKSKAAKKPARRGNMNKGPKT